MAERMVETRAEVPLPGTKSVCLGRNQAARTGGMIVAVPYAGILEYFQHFSPGRHPALGDFAASALGALCGGFVIALVRRRWPA